MTAEKTLELSYQIARAYITEQMQVPEAFEKFAARPHDFVNMADPTLSACAALAVDALETMSKKSGRGNLLQVAKSIYKETMRQNRRAIQGYFLDDQGHYCVCDGFRALRLLQPLQGLPEAEGMDALDRIMNDAAQNTKALALPTVADLKSIIAAHKLAHGSKDAARYDFGDGLPAVNAEYLLQLLQAFPDAEVRAKEGSSSAIAPIYFASAAGDALLMPVRKN